MVHIIIFHVTWLNIRLKHTIAIGYPLVNLGLVLEYTSCLITPEVADGMSVLCTIEFLRVVVELVGVAMDNTVLSRNITHLILVVGSIYTDIVMEILADGIIP